VTALAAYCHNSLVYFLLKIIRKQHKIQNKEHMNIHDTNDIDGMGNQGRIPDKKPRNRAM